MVEELWHILRYHTEEINKITQERMNHTLPFSIAKDMVDNELGIGHRFFLQFIFLARYIKFSVTLMYS
jgi:hypothetical protein